MQPPEIDFHLASGSPRRRELLSALGYRFSVIAAPVEERPAPGEDAATYVQRVALDKARAGRARLGAADSRPVLAADTEVEIDGAVLGKPGSLSELLGMLGRLSGRSHHVLSAVALCRGASEHVLLSSTLVTLRPLSEVEIRAYWESGEPRDKAGGYAIQGLGAEFVARIEGSYTGVVGLPLCETAMLLREHGIDGWRRACP
jgi:septum formation protein